MKMYSRASPYLSRVQERELLTGNSSTKKTYHIVLNIKDWESNYKVGDSIGVLPANDERQVDFILEKMNSNGEDLVLDHRANEKVSIRHFLTHRANLARVNRSFLSLLVEKGFPGSEISSLLESEDREKLSMFLQNHALQEFICDVSITPAEIAKVAMPLLPRFYSIANSAKVFPDEIHLLVAYVQYHVNGQERLGVGSHFLCDSSEIGETPIPIYVQPSNHFTVPEDLSKSMILIGPGTGVAPYRAFLQERMASQASGRNWLFFGERNQETDFYYKSFWEDLVKQGRLRLDLAFSRDRKEKSYVQHKMYEQRKSLWAWLEEGSLFYVCGNAEKMAKDVDAMLHRIIKEEGSFSEEDAALYVKKMRKEKRYLIDVY